MGPLSYLVCRTRLSNATDNQTIHISHRGATCKPRRARSDTALPSETRSASARLAASAKMSSSSVNVGLGGAEDRKTLLKESRHASTLRLQRLPLPCFSGANLPAKRSQSLRLTLRFA